MLTPFMPISWRIRLGVASARQMKKEISTCRVILKNENSKLNSARQILKNETSNCTVQIMCHHTIILFKNYEVNCLIMNR
jgi:hypothetical protein